MGETPEQQTDPDLGTSRDELRDLESRQTGVLESDANGNNPDGPEQSPDPEVGGPETPTPEDTADDRRHEHDPGSARPHSHG